MRTTTGRRAALAGLAVLTMITLGVAAGPLRADAQGADWPPITDYAAAGPYAVATTDGSGVTYFHPTDLGPGGVKHPVILWGNGSLTVVSFYNALLRHFASHGFIVAAAHTSFAGSGQEMLNGLSHLTAINGESGSPFFGKVDLSRVGTTGHSQGGGGAAMAARDPRVTTAFPIEAWVGASAGFKATDLKSTIFWMAGQEDALVPAPLVRAQYDATLVPAAYGEMKGIGHLNPMGDGGPFRAPATAWARWQLMGDATAGDLFVGNACGLCNNAAWTAYVTNAAFGSGPAPTSTTVSTPPTTPTTAGPTTTTRTTSPSSTIPPTAPPTTRPRPTGLLGLILMIFGALFGL